MKNIRIADMTLCRKDTSYSFKEKIEIARQLDKLNVNAVEIGEIENIKTDTLLVRTIASFVKNSIISVSTGITIDGVNNASAALQTAKHPRLRIELPMSTVGMEYTCHKKAPKMIAFITEIIETAKNKCEDVEFCAIDATRSDIEFLKTAIDTAIKAGATTVTICDNAAEMMPDDFSDFVSDIISTVNDENVSFGVMCDNKNGLATANAMLAVKKGATTVKTSVGGEITQLDSIGGIIKSCGNTNSISSDIKITELNRIVKQVMWVSSNAKNESASVNVINVDESEINLDANDTQNTVISAVKNLGYDLSDDDSTKVYEEFLRVAAKKKSVMAKELDAIVASTALQVPPTYKLISYVINNGNIISASAQIALEKDGQEIQGICIGDGPVDASFLAIEKIIGHHYELDDYKIQSVTEGKEAVGSAIVKLRSNGKLYSGNGISTDVMGASIRAYINAVNKIVYGEI